MHLHVFCVVARHSLVLSALILFSASAVASPCSHLYAVAARAAAETGVAPDLARDMLEHPEYRQRLLDIARAYDFVDRRFPTPFLARVARELTTSPNRDRATVLESVLRETGLRLPTALQSLWLPPLNTFVPPEIHKALADELTKRKEEAIERRVFSAAEQKAIVTARLSAMPEYRGYPAKDFAYAVRKVLTRLTMNRARQVILFEASQFVSGALDFDPTIPNAREKLRERVADYLKRKGIRDRDYRALITGIAEQLYFGKDPAPVTRAQVRERLVVHLRKLAQELAAEYAKAAPQGLHKEKASPAAVFAPALEPPRPSLPRLPRAPKRKGLAMPNTPFPPDKAAHAPAIGVFPIENPNGLRIDPVDEDTQRFFETGEVRNASWSRYEKIVEKRLRTLSSVRTHDQLRLLFNRHLEKLTNEGQPYYGYYSIRVDSQFRVVFHWIDNHAVDVQIVDYH